MTKVIDKTIINVTGVGNAGKGAVVDFLRDIPGVWAAPAYFEFDFFRVYGGFFDFLDLISEDRSQCRVDMAHRRLELLANKMGANPRWYNIPGILTSTGQRYDLYTNGEFLPATIQFLEDIVAYELDALWPYVRLERGGVYNFLRRFLYKIGIKSASHEMVRLVDYVEIEKHLKHYLNRIFSSFGTGLEKHIILNNFVEPFNPNQLFRHIEGAKSIAVIRDPRDVFLSGLSGQQITAKTKKFLPEENDGQSKSFLGTQNIDMFIRKYKDGAEFLHKNKGSGQLVIRFEDLIFHYESTSCKILRYLNLDSVEASSYVSSHFDPKTSRKNCRLWERAGHRIEIKKIESQLAAYLY